jgi:hypothetical protein
MALIISTLSSTGDRGTPQNSGDFYVSISTWESAQQAVHGAGDQSELHCYKGTTTTGAWQADGSYNGSVTIGGWTVSASDTVTIKAAAGEEHNGVRLDDGGSGFKMWTSSENNVLTAQQAFLIVENIELKNSNTAANARCMGQITFTSTNGPITINGLIADLDGHNSTSVACVDLSNARVNAFDISNSLIFSNEITINTNLSGAGTYTNCTFVGRGSQAQAAVPGTNKVVKNCVSMSVGAAWLNANGAGSTNNAQSDTSNSGPNTQDNVSLADGVDFVSPSTGDYTPQAGGKLDGTGTTPPELVNDIAGNPFADPSEIGAYAIPVAGGVTFDGPDIVAQSGTQDQVFTFDENGEGTV